MATSDQAAGLGWERDPLLSFAGIATYMRAPVADFDALTPGLVAVVGAPLDTTTAWRQGARYAPRALREASLHVVYWLDSAYESELIDLESGTILRRPVASMVVDLGDLNIYPNQVAKTAASFRQGTRAIVERGAFPLILGGDHFISLPCCQGVADVLAARGARLGFLQFGCELGLAGEDPVWGQDWAGSALRRLTELGVVAPRNLAWVGPSGLVPRAEWDWVQRNGATLATAEDVRREGAAEATRRALEAAASGCDAVYVSLGLDVLDSAHAPGLGATVVGGLTPTQLGQAMAVVARDERVAALDIVEVAPNLDRSGRTARLATNLIFDFLAPRALGRAPEDGRADAG
jgi:arginase family enzyme